MKNKFLSSSIALWCSVAIALATVLFFVFGKYRFYAYGAYTFRLFSFSGIALAVLFGAWMLATARKFHIKLRELQDIEARLDAYCKQYRRIYWLGFAAVLLLSACIVLSNNNSLIMLLLVLVLMLFFLHPNMYKAKVDLALSNEDMHALFGDRFIE